MARSSGSRNSRGRSLPGCGSPGDGADLDEGEAQAAEGVGALGVLVEAGGQAEAAVEGEPQGRRRSAGLVAAVDPAARARAARLGWRRNRRGAPSRRRHGRRRAGRPSRTPSQAADPVDQAGGGGHGVLGLPFVSAGVVGGVPRSEPTSAPTCFRDRRRCGHVAESGHVGAPSLLARPGSRSCDRSPASCGGPLMSLVVRRALLTVGRVARTASVPDPDARCRGLGTPVAGPTG